MGIPHIYQPLSLFMGLLLIILYLLARYLRNSQPEQATMKVEK